MQKLLRDGLKVRNVGSTRAPIAILELRPMVNIKQFFSHNEFIIIQPNNLQR